MRGLFITFEGGEGSGKSTQAALLAERLRERGVPVRLLREPGGTPVGEAVRAILLDRDHLDMDPGAELMLYAAARAQLVSQVIRPALAAGDIVLCDRFLDSTTAYQGSGRGLAPELIDSANHAATAGLLPDRTLLLDIEPSAGLVRAVAHGAADRLEAEELSFHERVRAGFLSIASTSPDRVRVIDAAGSVEDVFRRVREALADLSVIEGVLPESS